MRVTEIMINTPSDCHTITDTRETKHVTLAIVEAKERYPDWTSMVVTVVRTRPSVESELRIALTYPASA